MPITVVQTASGQSFPLSFTNPVTAGNTVVFMCDMIQTAEPVLASPTLDGNLAPGAYPIWNDGGSNAILQTAAPVCATSGWVLPNCPGGVTAINFGTANIALNAASIAYEISGLGPSPVVDVSSSRNDDSGIDVLSSGPSGNTTTAPAFVIGGMTAYNGSGLAPDGFTSTVGGAGGGGWAGYQIATTAGNSYTWTQSDVTANGWTAGVAALVAAAPAGTPVAAAFTGTGALTATVAARTAVAAPFTGSGALHATAHPHAGLDAYPDAVYTVKPETTLLTMKPENTTATIGPDNTGAAP